ncbi:hypothetical protein JVU11DRAFT_6068 [Chiua virens]|nr:hypothetical protein JVU11DRAFT_6068 [Chiua virens]
MSRSQGHDTSQTADPGDERQQRVLDQFHTFPFSSNEPFQQGLSGILAQVSTDEMPELERLELILKTKVFYFNRVTGHNIGLEDVRADHTADLNSFLTQSGDERNQVPSDASHGETRTLTFAELKNLIEQGKTDNIPNNKIILDTLNDGVLSKSTAPLRKKPWEVDQS